MIQTNQRGYLVIFAILFLALFLAFSASLLGYTTANLLGVRQSYVQDQALYLAQAGIEKAIHEINANPSYGGESNTALGSGSFTVSITSIDSQDKRVTSTGSVTFKGQTQTKTVKANIGINASVVSFHYGVQAGDGGFSLSNSSSITGNVFSSGPVIGSGGATNCNSSAGVGNCIYGDVVSAGPLGQVYGIHATGTVFSDSIGSASVGTTVDKDAYYNATKINTTVRGSLFPGSPDQSDAPLPISDDQINQWEDQAASGTIVSVCDNNGNYTINANATLGPAKILCNLIVKSNSGVLDVTGPIWVVGNISTQTGATIKMDPSLGSQNVAIIADDPSNRAGSGIITVGQSSIFQGSGSSGSFVFLISQNNSAENSGNTVALSMSQGASALVAYSAHGLASLSQSVSVKEVTGYKIALSQSANVTYDTGLPSALFESGPGGSWSYTVGSYAVTQ